MSHLDSVVQEALVVSARSGLGSADLVAVLCLRDYDEPSASASCASLLPPKTIIGHLIRRV
jgi:hypothetical protein